MITSNFKEENRKQEEYIASGTFSHEESPKDIIISQLEKLFPNGHEDFIPMCVNAIELHSKKNKAYAQGGNALGNFERRADFYSHYPGLDLSKPEVVSIVDAMKQLDAALWMLSQGYEDEKENIDARLGDCFVYLGIARILHNEGKEKK